MASIIPFPKQTESPDEEINRHIQDYLAEITPDKDFINYISHRMKNFIEKYTCKTFEPTLNLVVPANLSRVEADALVRSIDKGVQDTVEEMQAMVRQIIIERLHLEIEVYVSRKNIKYHLS